MATATETRAVRSYWLILTALMAAAVLIVGLVQPPWVFYGGLAILATVLVVGWKMGWQPPDAQRPAALERFANFPVYAAFLALPASHLLRDSSAAVVLVPVLSLALIASTVVWLRCTESKRRTLPSAHSQKDQ